MWKAAPVRGEKEGEGHCNLSGRVALHLHLRLGEKQGEGHCNLSFSPRAGAAFHLCLLRRRTVEETEELLPELALVGMQTGMLQA